MSDESYEVRDPGEGATDGASGRALAWPGVVFVTIAAFVGADLAADVTSGVGSMHLALELVALVLALGGVVATGMQLRREVRRANELSLDLEATRDDLNRSREEARSLALGLGTAIQHQLAVWELTPAECEVAQLILKGLSYKEIADARRTTERTVRHQALAIYRKANVSGRAEMSAFFLEELLLPPVSFLSPRTEPQRMSAVADLREA